MTIDGMRNYIGQMYASNNWKARVAAMEDRQVIGVYKSMKKRGQKPPTYEKANPICEQLNFFDLMGERQNA